MPTTRLTRWLQGSTLAAAATLCVQAPLAAQGTRPLDNPLITETAVDHEKHGRAYTVHDIPTFAVREDGTVDWPTYSGFRRYHAECHTCHGPDGEGSSYAPPLKESVFQMSYYEFVGTVAGGRQVVGASDNNVMPSFGRNPNVMCYLDDIYTYLRARGADAIPRGRPSQKERKVEAWAEAEDECMGF